MDGYYLSYYRPIAVLVVLIALVPLTTYLRLQTLLKFWIGLVFLFFSSLIGLSLQLLTPTLQSPSFLIQVPTFVALSIGESFCATALLELCYSKSPETMKTLLFGWFGVTIGIGQGLFQAFKIGTALIPIKAIPFAILAFVILLYGLLMKLTLPTSSETSQYDKPDSSDHPIDDDSPEIHLDTDDVIYYSDSDQDSEI